jgi:GNAT superfamily N-acetyltransferase
MFLLTSLVSMLANDKLLLMIRTATVADARAVAEVHVKSWQAAYRGLLPEKFLKSLSVDRREQQWRSGVQNPEQVVLVYERDHHIVAFCGFAPSRDDEAKATVAEVGTLYALESMWGQGVGQALWNEAVKKCVSVALRKSSYGC